MIRGAEGSKSHQGKRFESLELPQLWGFHEFGEEKNAGRRGPEREKLVMTKAAEAKLKQTQQNP